MRSIAAPEIVEEGIVVYAEKVEGFKFMKIEIFYSRDNPLFSWVECDNKQTRLWEQIITQGEKGTLFVYQNKDNLDIGFYKIIITAYHIRGNSITGSLLLGLPKPKKRLMIGLPYSVYPPLSLS